MGYKVRSDTLDTTMATPAPPDSTPHDPRGERARLGVAMAANVLMFVVGLVGWRLAHSTALLADAFDMLADATGYAVAFWAVGGQLARQRVAAGWSSVLLIALGIGVLAEVVHRWFVPEQPEGWWIAGFACLSLLVNGAVLMTLNRYRHSTQLHLRAAWVDTRADVLVNAGVLLSGVLVALLGYRVIDLAVGALVALFVIHEGWELWESCHEERDFAPSKHP
jgi:cation diffusion facilitator family transporter